MAIRYGMYKKSSKNLAIGYILYINNEKGNKAKYFKNRVVMDTFVPKRKIFCPKVKKQDVELAEKAFGQLKIFKTTRKTKGVFSLHTSDLYTILKNNNYCNNIEICNLVFQNIVYCNMQ